MAYNFGVLMYLILLGVVSSQCIVVRFTQNEIRLQNPDKTISETWHTIRQRIPSLPSQSHIDKKKMVNSMKSYKDFLIQCFIIFHLTWIMILTMYIPPVMNMNHLMTIFVCYWALLILVSLFSYFTILTYFKEKNSNYVYLGFFLRD